MARTHPHETCPDVRCTCTSCEKLLAPSLELISETVIHPLVFSLWVQGANTEVNDVCFSSTFFASSRNEKITSRLTH